MKTNAVIAIFLTLCGSVFAKKQTLGEWRYEQLYLVRQQQPYILKNGKFYARWGLPAIVGGRLGGLAANVAFDADHANLGTIISLGVLAGIGGSFYIYRKNCGPQKNIAIEADRHKLTIEDIGRICADCCEEVQESRPKANSEECKQERAQGRTCRDDFYVALMAAQDDGAVCAEHRMRAEQKAAEENTLKKVQQPNKVSYHLDKKEERGASLRTDHPAHTVTPLGRLSADAA